MSFSEKLRAARETRGLTQQQVADYMEIDKSTYCGYETGKRQPDVQKIKQITKILGVSGDDLLETEYIGQEVAPDELKLTEGEMRILSAFREMSPERQRALADLLGISEDQK